jgi:nucleoside-diphosphate-sugar epimerase
MESLKFQLIIGSGPVGMAVVDELQRKKIPVKIANKSGKIFTPASMETLKLNAADPNEVRKAALQASVVYNCSNVPYNRWTDLLPEIHHGIIEGIAGTEAKLVVMENLYMYGATQGKVITEDLAYHPCSRKGEVRARLSEELFNAHAKGKIRAVSGRASDFFGPRALQSALGERIFFPALKGKAAQVLGNPDLLHTYTYVPDIGKALVVLGERDEALGKAWHLPNPETVTTRQIVEMIYKKLDYPLKIKSASRGLIRMIGIFNPVVRELIEMMYEFEEPFLVDDTRFRKLFGLSATPLDKAIIETIEWYKHSRRE